MACWQLLTLFTCCLLQLPVIRSYTVDDITNKCRPCVSGSRLIHPTDCTTYLYCSSYSQWMVQSCPASTYYNSTISRCVNPINQRVKTCEYKRRNKDNSDVPLESLGVCRHITEPTAKPTSNFNERTTPKNGENNGGGTKRNQDQDKDFMTKLLASLLAASLTILIVVILVIFIYKRRQRQKRPENFYRRSLPKSKPLPPARPPATSATHADNTTYLTKSLLDRQGKDDSINIDTYEDIYEPGYTEIPEIEGAPRITYEKRPPLVKQNAVLNKESSVDSHIYAEAKLPPYVTEYSVDNITAGYQHPTTDNGAGGHQYAHPDIGNVDPTHLKLEPLYEYSNPESAHPTLSLQRPLQGQGQDTGPSSPPYYVDPIPDEPVDQRHQYHTLEPPKK